MKGEMAGAGGRGGGRGAFVRKMMGAGVKERGGRLRVTNKERERLGNEEQGIRDPAGADT